jgi:hypothetical protein
MNSRWAGRALTVLAFLAIGLLTLRPRPELAPLSAATPVWCVVCGAHGVVDVVLNVLLFIPLGLGLGMAGLRPRAAILLAALTTLTVELLQLGIVAGRDASLSDLVTNTLGAAIGMVLARRWREVVLPTPRVAAALTAAWAALVLLVTAGTGLAVAPSMPDPPYWGQWTPELGGLLQHEGRVESAQVEDIATPGRRVPASAALADSLADGEIGALVTAVLAGPPRRTAPIFRMVDGFGHQALLIAQDGRDLIVETGTRSERLRLRGLTVRLEDAMPAGERVRIAVRSDPREYAISVHAMRGPSRELMLSRSVAWGWALLVPFMNRLGARHGIMDALWLGSLMLPLGWWSVSIRSRLSGLAIGVAVLAVVLAGGSALFALPAPAWTAWAGGIAGLAGGWAGAALARSRVRQA